MASKFSTSIIENGEELRWNLHSLHLKFCLNTLLKSGKFADCSIFVERKTIPTHRIVLSMFSPYFEALLSENLDKHPVIILNDEVTYQDAEDLMKYIYTGEVTIDPARMAHFTEVCIKFKIVGFSFVSDSAIEFDPETRADSLKDSQVATAEQKPDENPKKSRKHSNVVTDVIKNKSKLRNSSMKTSSSQVSENSNQKSLNICMPKLKLDKAMKAPGPKGKKSLTPLTSGTLLVSRRPSIFPSELKLSKPETFPCSFCDRSYKTHQSHYQHRRECKSNPDAVVKECPKCHKEMPPTTYSKHNKKCNRLVAGSSNKENEK